jgi:hypothetical protein
MQHRLAADVGGLGRGEQFKLIGQERHGCLKGKAPASDGGDQKMLFQGQ